MAGGLGGVDVDVLQLLSRLVEFRTVNDPSRGVRPGRECADFIAETLESWGVPARVSEVEGYYTVHGQLGGGPPRVLLLAHWDVVPVDEGEWTRPPFRLTVEGGRAYGRGAADDKGNVAAGMVALRLLAEAGVEGVYYAFTGDEEIGGARGAGWLASTLEEGPGLPGFLVNADGGGEVVIVRRRNAFSVRVTVGAEEEAVEGEVFRAVFHAHTPVLETRHAAYITPLVDSHPLVAASHFARVRRLLVAGLEGSFVKGNVVPGSVSVDFVAPGGDRGVVVDRGLTRLLHAVLPLTRTPIRPRLYSDYGVSITPNLLRREGGAWVLHLDVRAMEDDVSVVCGAFEWMASHLLPDATVKCGGGRGYLYTPEDARIVREAQEAAAEAGLRAPLPVGEAGGASDSRYFSPRGVEAIDFGPVGGNVHGPDEWVSVESLRRLPRFYAALLSRLARA